MDQIGHQLVADPISQELQIAVGGIQDKVNLVFLKKRHDISPGLFNQGTNISIVANREHPGKTQGSTAPEQVHQDEFGIVIGMMPQGYFVVGEFPGNTTEKIIAGLSSQCLKGTPLALMKILDVGFCDMLR